MSLWATRHDPRASDLSPLLEGLGAARRSLSLAGDAVPGSADVTAHGAQSAHVAFGSAEVKPIVLAGTREVRVVEGVVPDDLTPPFAQGGNFPGFGERLLGDRFVVMQHGVRGIDDLVAAFANPQAEVGVVVGDSKIHLV